MTRPPRPALRTTPLRLAFACLLPCALGARPLEAQTVIARVLDDETNAPVVGALAHLVLPDGGVVRNTLTDELGRAIFTEVAAGSYRIRADMIGRRTRETEPFAVEAGPARQVELRLPAAAIVLEGIEVEAGERCRIRPEEGLAVGRVWDEARKALEAATYTDRTGVYRYRTTLYERDYDRDARAVLGERSREREAWLRVPFASLPAEDLVADGFVRREEGGARMFYAPDAGVLLSDAFLDTHCFRLREGDEPDLLGLEFEPVGGGTRGRADIGGTLWLRRATAELAWLEYRYVNLPPDASTPLVGGRVEFRRMPNGTWIVPEWWIRMPRLVREVRDGLARERVDGYRVTGGRVLDVRSAAGDAVLRGPDAGAIEGFVQDSLGVLPLGGVRVGLVGSNHMVFTDPLGRFRLTNLGEGVYTLRFVHDRFEAYGVQPAPVRSEVRAGEVSSLFYRMPSLGELLFEVCRSEAPPEGTAVLTGIVHDAERDRPLEGVAVRVRWEDFRMSPRGPDRRIEGAEVHGFETVTDAEGRYRFCEVPEARLLYLELERDGLVRSDTLRIPEFARALARSPERGP